MYILLVTLVIMLRLRATTSSVVFALCRNLITSLATRVRIAMLSVAAGLLVTRSDGEPTSVTVTTMCRCTLLESRRGQLLI